MGWDPFRKTLPDIYVGEAGVNIDKVYSPCKGQILQTLCCITWQESYQKSRKKLGPCCCIR
jgi:hypothetical protein